MAQADIDIGMSVQDATEYERGDSDRFLSRESCQQIQIKLFQVWVARRAIDACWRGMHHKWHITFHYVGIKGVQSGIIQWPANIGADVATKQIEIRERAVQLFASRVDVLHR